MKNAFRTELAKDASEVGRVELSGDLPQDGVFILTDLVCEDSFSLVEDGSFDRLRKVLVKRDFGSLSIYGVDHSSFFNGDLVDNVGFLSIDFIECVRFDLLYLSLQTIVA